MVVGGGKRFREKGVIGEGEKQGCFRASFFYVHFIVDRIPHLEMRDRVDGARLLHLGKISREFIKPYSIST